MYCAAGGLPAPNGTCYAGYFCSQSSQKPNPVNEVYGSECPAGYYCPNGTTAPFACPPGTFNNQTLGTRPQDCLPCPSGQFCEGYANRIPDGLCEPGFYCARAAYTSKPVTFTDLTHNSTDRYTCPIYSVNQTGGICLKGTYCPRGSDQPILCDLGTYCGEDELEYPSGNCTAGYFCDYNATTPTSMECPVGHYCPQGTPIMIECPPGTFNGNPKMSERKHCANCTAGFYCPYAGMSEATFRCVQGYYCPDGSSVNNTEECPKGHYCPTGSPRPIPCAAGM